jgi:hypothetical protein
MAVTIPGSANIPIQCVQTVITSTIAVSGLSTFTDIAGFSLTITPTNASNKILIMTNFVFGITGSTTCLFNWVRNGTNLSQPGGTATWKSSFRHSAPNTSWAEQVYASYLDSPGTTAACTYKLQWVPYDTGRTVYINRAPATGTSVDNAETTSNMIAMEIAYG